MHDPRRAVPDRPAANGGRQAATAQAKDRKGGDPPRGRRISGFRNPPFRRPAPDRNTEAGLSAKLVTADSAAWLANAERNQTS